MNARGRLAAWLRPVTGTLARWLASFINWLRTRGAWPILIAIAILTVASVVLITNEVAPQLATGIVMALLGVALVLGCLFAFPYAGVWHEDRPATPRITASSSTTSGPCSSASWSERSAWSRST